MAFMVGMALGESMTGTATKATRAANSSHLIMFFLDAPPLLVYYWMILMHITGAVVNDSNFKENKSLSKRFMVNLPLL